MADRFYDLPVIIMGKLISAHIHVDNIKGIQRLNIFNLLFHSTILSLSYHIGKRIAIPHSKKPQVGTLRLFAEMYMMLGVKYILYI